MNRLIKFLLAPLLNQRGVISIGTATAIGAGVQALGGMAANASARAESGKARSFANMQANRAWRRTMDADNTKFERASHDLKRAGLNPMLAAGMNQTAPGISAGGTPGGAQQENIAKGASATALQYKRLKEEVGVMEKTKTKLANEATKASKDAKRSDAEAKAIQLDNVRREQEAEFMRKNPEFKKVKMLRELLPGGLMGAAGALGTTALGHHFLNKRKGKGKVDGGWKPKSKNMRDAHKRTKQREKQFRLFNKKH